MKKNEVFITAAKCLLFTCLMAGVALNLSAQSNKNRTIEKVFDGKTALWASHRYGALVLKKGSGSQTKVTLTISAGCSDETELQQFLDHFQLSASEAADNKVDVKTDDVIKNWQNINGRSTIKFTDGKSFSGIKDFKMSLEIEVPKLRYATLENKYADIRVEEGTAAVLAVNLFEGRVEAPGKYENVTLALKYSKGVIGSFSTCKAELFECKLELGDGGALTLGAKYSGLKIGKLGEVTLDLFESQVNAQNATTVTVNISKYSELTFQELNSMHLESSFEDKIRLAKVGSLSASQSKYSKYNVEGLWKSLRFPSSFEDDIVVRNVGGTFEGLEFNGKYTDVTLPIPASVKYRIDADLKYGKLIFPEQEMESSIFREKSDQITVQATMKGAGDNAPKLNIKSFEGTIKLQ